MNSSVVRVLDILGALIALCFGLPVILLVLVLGVFDTGSPLFVQERVGREMKLFRLLKFRTMAIGTEPVATHLVQAKSVTKYGSLLRRSKLDELPQLLNVLFGNMSFVGPRPCLPSQLELIRARNMRGVFRVKPGITGLAQVNGIDMSTPELLAEWDERMIASFSLGMYFRLIIITMFGAGSGDRIMSGGIDDKQQGKPR